MSEEDNKIPENLAATMAARFIFHPERTNLADVSNIPSGMTHGMTSLRAYSSQLQNIINQVRARQRWYAEQQIWKSKVRREWVELKETKDKKELPDEERKYGWVTSGELTSEKLDEMITKTMEELNKADSVDLESLFVNELQDSYCHISRGKNAYLLKGGIEMAVTDIETRNPDSQVESAKPRFG